VPTETTKTPFEIAPLTAADAEALARLIEQQRLEYLEHFHPFPFDAASIASQLSAARHDRFWAMRSGSELAGFLMLRGWDAGFRRPSFGVFVGEQFAGRGGARQALNFAIEYCRAQHVPALMLSAHPGNKAALRVYEAAGFIRTGEKSSAQYDIYELHL
jgi:ribosomal-protein-alanine N-acetyltransferase